MSNDQTIEAQDNNESNKYTQIIAVAFALGWVFDYFFFRQQPGLSFPVYVALLFFVFLALAKRFQTTLDKSIIYLAGPLFFFSIMVYVRSSEFLAFLNLAITYYLLILIANGALGSKILSNTIADYFKPLILIPLNTLDKLFVALANIVASRSRKNEKTRGKILRGIIMAVPVLILFVFLLSSADIIFKQYVDKIFSIQITPETVFRTILILSVTGIFTGVFTYALLLPKNKFSVGRSETTRGRLDIIEGSVFLGSIDLLFLSFILIQVTYLFGGKRNIAIEGATYAEYARSGFFQLLAVSVISFLLIWLTEKYIFQENEGHLLIFKLLSGFLIFEVMVIMASGFKRLQLYENAFGFTSLRFYSHSFVIWLAVVFLFFLIKIVFDKPEKMLAFSTFVSILIFLAALNIINPDAFIARQNIARFQEAKKLDANYLSTLSDDAVSELVKVLDIKDKPASFNKERFAGQLWRRRQELLELTKTRGWQSNNLSRSKALKELNRRASMLVQYKDLADY